MNKFLVAFLCGILAVNSSFAVVECPKDCVTWDKNDPTLVTVCFENAQQELTSPCKGVFTDFINDLIMVGKEGYKVDLKYAGTADVVGRADSTGNKQSNLTLSKNRAKHINGLLDEIIRDKQFNFVYGAAGDVMANNSGSSDPTQRVVRIRFPMISSEGEKIVYKEKYYDVLDKDKADAIDNAEGELDKLFADEKDNVWRDGQGKFNYHRLISDGVAGVVLGTTGALVTSKLVKEKQVKDGFEDINCAIGDWVVAGWGDEFWVDIQK